MRTIYPPYRICAELTQAQREYMERMTGTPLSEEKTFSEVDAGMLKPLLLQSLRVARQENDAALCNILLSLLKNIEDPLRISRELYLTG